MSLGDSVTQVFCYTFPPQPFCFCVAALLQEHLGVSGFPWPLVYLVSCFIVVSTQQIRPDLEMDLIYCITSIINLLQCSLLLFGFQCRMTIKDVSAATMYDVLHDGLYRKKWDPTMLESFDIARLSPNADVGYYSCACLLFAWVKSAIPHSSVVVSFFTVQKPDGSNLLNVCGSKMTTGENVQ